MSRKGKIDPVIKVKAVEEVISGRSSISAEAKKVGVDDSSLSAWIAIYK